MGQIKSKLYFGMENINEKAKMLYIHKGIYVYAGRRIQLGITKRKIEKI